MQFETPRRSDAACIAEALDAPLSQSPRGWLVTFQIQASTDLGRLIAALHSCLEEHAIPMVTIALDDDRYVMEASDPQARVAPYEPRSPSAN